MVQSVRHGVCNFSSVAKNSVLDLATFNRALRLRWQWFKWKDSARPWSEMVIQLDSTEVELFRACTKVTLGTGERVAFWHDNWLDGRSPKHIAPDLFKLAWRKNENVATALTNGRWKRGLRRLSTVQEINQFVELWAMVRDVHLNEQTDDIAWRFSPSGIYSSSSAYLAQFVGTFGDDDWERLWHSKVENKCKFFCWLILQNKLWTADRIISNGGQANPICPLCRTLPEDAEHMLANCAYSVQVWNAFVHRGIGYQQLPQPNYRRLKQWWTSMLDQCLPQMTSQNEQTIIYIAWNIWKERCRRVFDNKEMTMPQIVSLITQDLRNWQMAHEPWEE